MAGRRQRQGMSQATLAREVGRRLGSEFSRDRLWNMEHGKPRHPTPDLVSAVADALGRPLSEALEALGYALPQVESGPISPSLRTFIEELSTGQQNHLATALPALISIGASLAFAESPTRLSRVAEPRAEYNAAGNGNHKED